MYITPRNLLLSPSAEDALMAAANAANPTPPPTPASAPLAAIPSSSPKIETVLDTNALDGDESDVPQAPVAPKTEAPKVEEPEQTLEEPPVTPPVAPATPPAPPAERDYSIYPPEIAEALKKVPNHVFNAVRDAHAKIVSETQAKVAKLPELEKQVAELQKGALPTNYYEHPSAYQFDSRYQQASAIVQQAGFEENHWVSQLQRVKSGEDFVLNLTGFEEATGKPVYDKIPVSAENSHLIESKIMQNLSQIQLAKQRAGEQVNQVVQQFQNESKQINGWINQQNEKFFPKYKEVDKTPRAKDYNFFKKEFLPPQLQNSPLADGMAKAYLTILDLQDAHAAALKEIEQLKRGQAAATLAQPSPAALQGTAPRGVPAGKAGSAGVLSLAEITADDND